MTEASDLLQKLSLDSPSKTDNAVEVAEEVIFFFADVTFISILIVSIMSLVLCSPGYDRAVNKWGDYSRYTSNDGVEILPVSYTETAHYFDLLMTMNNLLECFY
ncbi:hypothetical protein BHE74_00038781 [Ensete ventricosum]|nr:hypothetical protein BHE74_00038781 [Ensete ventricosum]